MISHEIPGRLQEFVGSDVFNINNKYFLCIVDYHSKIPIVKQVEEFSTDKLIKNMQDYFSDYGLPSKIVSDMDTDFVSDTFENFCERFGIPRLPSLATPLFNRPSESMLPRFSRLPMCDNGERNHTGLIKQMDSHK